MHTDAYVGRFAPSPTGPLHFGSLIAAVASYLDAKSHHGRWILRIDDVDSVRVVPGAADNIVSVLAAYNFQWDGSVVFQSHCLDLYQEALCELSRQGVIYPCSCSRRDLIPFKGIYPGYCRQGPLRANRNYSLRVKTDHRSYGFCDAIQGHFSQNLNAEVGDFVVRRADHIYAYQLAVVVDDAEQNITHIVRGSDLLDSTPRQIYLRQLLGLPEVVYMHLPVITNSDGYKLSKQTGADALSIKKPNLQLAKALAFLGHAPPQELMESSLETLWQWAELHWRRSLVPAVREIRASP